MGPAASTLVDPMTFSELDVLIAVEGEAGAIMLTWSDWIALMGGWDGIDHLSYLRSGQAIYRGVLVWLTSHEHEPSRVLSAEQALEVGLPLLWGDKRS